MNIILWVVVHERQKLRGNFSPPITFLCPVSRPPAAGGPAPDLETMRILQYGNFSLDSG